MYVEYLLNQWMDFLQTCIDKLKSGLDFIDLDLIFNDKVL